jgi:hypothetical protein
LKKIFLENFFNDLLFYNLLKKCFENVQTVLELGAGKDSYVNFKDRDYKIIAFDLIEHFEKNEGYQLLKDIVRVAGVRVIVFTPNGFVPQSATDDNPFQEHKSGWTYQEMKKSGFKVYGVNGFMKLRGMYAVPKIKPREFGNFISNLSQIFLNITGLKKYSYAILCVKDVK